MMNLLVSFIVDICTRLTSVILGPINLLIYNEFPSLDSALSSIANYFSYAGTYINYFIDAFGLTQVAVDMIIFYFTFMLVVPLSVSAIRYAVKWWHYLVP